MRTRSVWSAVVVSFAALAAPAGAALLAPAGTATSSELAPVPEERAASRVLSWDDCVKLALERSPDLLSALRASESSRASYLQSYNGVLPNLSLTNSYASGSSALNGNGKPSYSAAASAGVSLFDLGKISNIRSASAAYDQTLASLRQTSANLRLNLRTAYASVLLAEINVDVSRRILEIRRVGAEMVTLRYQSGHEYKGNMMNTDAQYLQAQATLAAALRSLRSTRRTFARQLGLDDFEEVTATGTLAAAPPPLPPVETLALLDQRPDVQLQEAVLRSTKASLLSSESSLFPSLTANYSRTRGSSGSEFPASPYGWSAGATLSYPLFGGGPTNTYFAVQASKRSLERAEEDLRTTRDAAVAELENNWASYAGAVDTARVQQAQLVAARQRNDEADVQYATGLVTFDNWSLIVTERVSDEQSAVQSLRDAVVAQAAWEKSLGKILGE